MDKNKEEGITQFDHDLDEGFDICYDCEAVGEYGTFEDVEEDSFAIYCPNCIQYHKKPEKAT